MSKGEKEPTYTHVVGELLAKVDDFMSKDMIFAALRPRFPLLTAHVLSTILVYLKKRKVVAAIEVEGALWWYANGDDDRVRPQTEAKPKDGPKRSRYSLPKHKPTLDEVAKMVAQNPGEDTGEDQDI